MSACRGNFDKTKCMSSFIEDEQFQKNVMKFGKKSSLASTKFNSEPVNNKKYVKTKKSTEKMLLIDLYISNID